MDCCQPEASVNYRDEGFRKISKEFSLKLHIFSRQSVARRLSHAEKNVDTASLKDLEKIDVAAATTDVWKSKNNESYSSYPYVYR